MTKTTNAFFKILQALLLIFISFLHFLSGGVSIIPLFSCVLFGIIAYKEDYFVLIIDFLVVLLSVILLNVLNVYIDLLSVIIDTLSLSLAGIVTGLMLKNKQKHFSIIVATTLSKLLITLLSFLVIKRAGEDIFVKLIEEPFRTYFDYAIYMFSQSGVYNSESIKLLEEMVEVLISSIATFMPAILIITSVLTAYFSYVLTKKIIEFVIKEKLYVEPFSHLKINTKTSNAFFVFVILSMLIPSSVISDAILNIVLIFFFAYLVCGLSIIDFYFKKTKIWWWIRGLIYIIVLPILSVFISAIPLVMVIVAMIDVRRDLRKLNTFDIVLEIKDDNNES